jgi:hypothetical protein
MSQSIRDQIKNIDVPVAPSYPPRELSRNDDFTEVTDLRRGHDVLYIGGNAYFPAVRKCVRSVTTATKRSEVERLMTDGRVFDRVFIARENLLGEEAVTAAVTLTHRDGLVCFFSEGEGLRDAFVEIVEQNWPTANVWLCDSNVGPIVMTDAKGAPSYLD